MSNDKIQTKVEEVVKMARPVILEYGSAFSKLGFSGYDNPRLVQPTIVGQKENISSSNIEQYSKQIFTGVTALENRDKVEIIRPIINKKIVDWMGLQGLMCVDIHQRLNINPELHTALFVDSYPSNEKTRIKIAEILFEQFQFPAIHITSQAVMPLFNLGRTTGIVVDSGYESTVITPVKKGEIISEATQQLNIGGFHITKRLRKFLREQGFPYSDEEDQYYGAARNIKESLCYVALDPEKELELVGKVSSLVKTHQLPDGEKYTIGIQRFMSPEIMFNPSLENLNGKPLHELIYKSITTCDEDLQSELWSNIVLSGGNSEIPGFNIRLSHELKKIAPKEIDVRILTPSHPCYAVWNGASILSSRRAFRKQWITKEQFNEQGLYIT
ncbi:MAG: hypothetical protein ACTSPI_10220 [Candidatus Heimdallarchaeaceae archaeon]